MALRESNVSNLDLNSPFRLSNTAKGKSKKTIEQTFTKLTQLEHVLLRPDTYIGSVERIQQQVWVWSDSDNCMKQKDITFPPGLYKIFDEILVNAADHKQRDSSMNTIKIEIDTENQLISVWNNGAGIPVEIHQKEKIYVPELIFGNLLTSSNYDDNEKKVVGGRNGFGAKLANIFSTEFTIETADAQRGKRYKQVFRNNMADKDEPIIKSNPKKEAYTKISFSPDLARFGMTHLDDDIVSLLKKRVYDIAGINAGLKVYFNGSKLPIKSFKDYVALYTNKDNDCPVMYERLSNRWEVAITASDGQLAQVSFVNSIWTIKGGTHVTHVADQIASKVGEHIAKKNKGMKVKPFQIKSQLSLFINCLIENPSFDSQTKETLTTKPGKFGSKWSFSELLAKQVMKSDIIENVLAFAKFREGKELAKTDGGKRIRLSGIKKFYDANKAGTREGAKCTLVLTEGDSAMALAVSGLSVVGRNYYGVFPLRGKPLNVREAKHKQIMDNAEITNLKKILGLQHNKKYSEETIKSLRYGHVLIMADQDHDGSHIKGLIINFFDHFWPGLLKVDGFLQEFITPIVKCIKGAQNKVFFTMPEYRQFITSDEAIGWKPKYYKGLGTSTAAEAKVYFSNLRQHLHEFQHRGDEDIDMIELAFSKQRVNDRKDWIASYTPGTFFNHGVDQLTYSNFVNKELILFSVYDNERSIPSIIDGLKPSQRKVMFGCFKRKLTKSEIKVVQLAGYVAEHAAYHHGDASLQSTIIGLAQNFVGSNNINFLVPAGQFGTRLQGGKDAASSRYIFTKLAPIARAVFPEVDDSVLSYLKEEEKNIEPKWYCPVIPTVLVNGSEGIGTGWSSSVPCYNPRDLISNIRRLLDGQPMEPMAPWYRGFRGSVIPVRNAKSFDVYGILKKGSEDNTFKVEELPIRSWTTSYKDFLESNLVGNAEASAPFIKDFNDNSTENNVNFTISTTAESSRELSTPDGYKKLKLSTSLTTSNMVLFDKDGRLRKYDTPEEIVHEFFETRFALYEARRLYLLKELEEELLCLDNKQRFILMVVDGKLKVAKRKKSELLAELKRLKFDPILKTKAKKDKDTEPSPSDEEEEHQKTKRSPSLEKGYDYLLSMPLWSLTTERVAKLADQRIKTTTEREWMDAVTVKELWEADLVCLEDAISKDDAETAAMAKDLERVSNEARARQQGGRGKGKRGKGTKSYRDDDLFDSEDLEVVPLPLARVIAPKKTRAPKASVAEKKPQPKKSRGETADKKRSKKVLAHDEMSDEDSLEDDFSEYSDEDEEIIDLLDDVVITDTQEGVQEDHVTSTGHRKNAVRPRGRAKNRKAIAIDDDSEDEIPRKTTTKPTKRTIKSKAAQRKKAVSMDVVDSEDEDDVAENIAPSSNTRNTFDFPEDSDEEEALSLSQRLAKRLTVSDAVSKKSTRNAAPRSTSVLQAAGTSKAGNNGYSKRPRELKAKQDPIEHTVISPSPSPKPKKTRVKSPQGPKGKRRGKKIQDSDSESSEAEEDDVPVEAAPRPRRQRAATKKVVIIDSDDSDANDDDDFEQFDGDDSDFE